MRKLGYTLLLMLLAPCTSVAAGTFPVGVPVETEAIFCFDRNSAQTIADNKGIVPDALILECKCAPLRGVAIYVKEVYQKDGWAVWELRSGNIPVFYEATNWRPRPQGIEI